MRKKVIEKFYGIDLAYLPVLVVSSVTIFVIFQVYSQTQDILKERLRDRLSAIASTSSLLFSPEDIEKIQNRDSLGSSELRNLTNQLKSIREKNNDIMYVYLLRPTDDPNIQKFIADADTLAPLEEIDLNNNQLLDEDEIPPQPNDEYDTSELPAFNEALKGKSIADYDLNSDQWGTFLSGYSPVLDDNQNIIAILGIDVEVSDFNTLIRSTLAPFIVLAIILIGGLLSLTIVTSKIWKNRVEIVKELDRQKDELLSIVSHQLATPISSLKWYTEMMIDGDLGKITKQQKEHLGSMMSVAGNLADLVSMILDVSRIQLGRMKIEKQELDLNKFFKEILGIIVPKAEQKPVNLNINLPKKLPKALLDRRYTHMVIENLLSNAVKYTPENGTVDLKVELRGKTLYCEVKDTGCGIPKEDQEKIFGRMFRASNVRNSVDGNGFGLFVAKGAVEAQGGKIWFESKEKIGTSFFVILPLK